MCVRPARRLYLGLRLKALRFLLRDRDGKYGEAFDAVLQAEDMGILNSARQAPRMNAHCERVDHILIMNETHARHVLAVYERHYNQCRPHQARNQLPPGAPEQPAEVHDLDIHKARATGSSSPLRRRDRLLTRVKRYLYFSTIIEVASVSRSLVMRDGAVIHFVPGGVMKVLYSGVFYGVCFRSSRDGVAVRGWGESAISAKSELSSPGGRSAAMRDGVAIQSVEGEVVR